MIFSTNINAAIYKVTIALAIFITAGAIDANAQFLNPTPGKTVTEQMQGSHLYRTEARNKQIKELLDYAFQFRGVRYRRGAMSPAAFDCSGFTSYVFNKFGYSLNRCSRDQINNGTRVERNQEQPGDLVFFGGRANRAGIGHVGIVVSRDDDGFTFIHAATRTGITVSHSTESYYRSRYRGACRVVQ